MINMSKQLSMKERYELDKKMYEKAQDKDDHRTIDEVARDFSKRIEQAKANK